jgi:hypothetical protein
MPIIFEICNAFIFDKKVANFANHESGKENYNQNEWKFLHL